MAKFTGVTIFTIEVESDYSNEFVEYLDIKSKAELLAKELAKLEYRNPKVTSCTESIRVKE